MFSSSFSESSSGSDGAPPYSDTGVQNTQSVLSGGLEGCIDWIQVTFPVGITLEYVVTGVLGLKMEDFSPMPKGMNGYKQAISHGYIKVLFDGNDDMGVHVILSGMGVRQMEAERFNSSSDFWAEWLHFCLLVNARFTRFDVAIDDRIGYFTLSQIQEEIEVNKKRNIRSLFGGGKIEKEFSLDEDSEDGGFTIYFGSRQSDTLVRFYDKAQQQNVEGFWLRTEVQTRDDNAQECAKRIAGGLEAGTLCAGVLKKYINFLDPNHHDSNKSRRRVADWWSCFLGEVEKVRLSVPKGLKTIREKMDHTTLQYAPSFAMYFAYLGERKFNDWFLALMEDGFIRMSDLHWLQVEKERLIVNAV